MSERFLSKQVITAFTVGRYGGKVLYRHTAGELWGGLRAVLGRFGGGFSKVLGRNRGYKNPKKSKNVPYKGLYKALLGGKEVR